MIRGPLGDDSESTRRRFGVHLETIGNPLGAPFESIMSPLGVHFDSTWSPIAANPYFAHGFRVTTRTHWDPLGVVNCYHGGVQVGGQEVGWYGGHQADVGFRVWIFGGCEVVMNRFPKFDWI